MNSQEFDKCLKAYNESGNDYRYAFSREQVKEIKKALEQRTLVDEIRELMQEENASTTKN